MPEIEKLTLTVKEMAAALGISLPKAYDLTHRVDFPVIHLGRKKVIPKEAFLKWLNNQGCSQLYASQEQMATKAIKTLKIGTDLPKKSQKKAIP